MKKSQRIQTIADLKALHEKKSLAVLVEYQQRRQLVEQQLEHLRSYRQEYVDKFGSRSGAGITVQVLVEFRSFIDKVDIAIAGQEKAVQQALFEEARKREAWQKCHQQTESLQKVCTRLELAEIKVDNKREQAESDDRSSRSSKNSSFGMGNA